MAAKKTVALVGMEDQYPVALQLASSGFRVLLVSRNISAIQQSETAGMDAEIEIIDCLNDACWEADLIILALPADQANTAAEIIKAVATQKIIIYIPTEVASSNNYVDLAPVLPFSGIVTVSRHTTTLSGIAISTDDYHTVKQVLNIIANNFN